MKQPTPRLPERLRTGGATELERRILQSATNEQPSRELSERMAAAIGIATPLLLAAPKPTSSTRGAPAKVTAFNARALLPWLSGAVVVLAIGGAVLGLRDGSHPVSLGPSAPVVTRLPLTESSHLRIAPLETDGKLLRRRRPSNTPNRSAPGSPTGVLPAPPAPPALGLAAVPLLPATPKPLAAP